ncbi:hypothetical protein LX97_03404 [Nonlabens dokdonensis]|jgi:hypothetical protein|uniref:DUF4129 domain-containing protein n=2 Tax=Nonlabens dokdonensis TaxID=328515 RepID=L7WDB4_NONDD|nr:hypothetical protein [Nonlabens dokdonensis]AGC77921.1 hypothetical protein DDD_2794 [Nonlabens dokdonensis DSW-6]PZX36647.1 hypothetical protein LX97_03404 [Nonlabens dokdonensis]
MKNNFRILLFILCIASSFLSSSQIIENLIKDIEDQPVEIVDTLNRVYDTRELTVREIDKDLSEEYSGGEYNYERVQGSSENIFARFMSWALQGLQDIFGFTLTPLTVEILTYLFYFIIGVLVIYMIVKLVSNESASKLFGKSKEKGTVVTIEDTHIEEIDFTEMIQDSEREGNYRNAIRYQYLSLLKNLSAKQMISWDFQKTNTDYYKELKNPLDKEQFKKLSYLYDYVWYGEFAIDQDSYKEAVDEFKTLKNRAA